MFQLSKRGIAIPYCVHGQRLNGFVELNKEGFKYKIRSQESNRCTSLIVLVCYYTTRRNLQLRKHLNLLLLLLSKISGKLGNHLKS